MVHSEPEQRFNTHDPNDRGENPSDRSEVEATDQLVVHGLETEGRAAHALDVDAVQSFEMLDSCELDVEPDLVTVIRVTFAVRRERLRRA
jgi:hypothetical protein